jgi:hypothetical protein
MRFVMNCIEVGDLVYLDGWRLAVVLSTDRVEPFCNYDLDVLVLVDGNEFWIDKYRLKPITTTV